MTCTYPMLLPVQPLPHSIWCFLTSPMALAKFIGNIKSAIVGLQCDVWYRAIYAIIVHYGSLLSCNQASLLYRALTALKPSLCISWLRQRGLCWVKYSRAVFAPIRGSMSQMAKNECQPTRLGIEHYHYRKAVFAPLKTPTSSYLTLCNGLAWRSAADYYIWPLFHTFSSRLILWAVEVTCEQWRCE